MYLCRALTVKASKTSALPLRGWYPRCTNLMNFGTVSSMSSLIFSVIACLEGRFTKPEKFRNQTPYISLKAPQWPKFTAPCCWRQRIARFWTTPLALCLELSFFLIVGVQHRSVILPYQSTKNWRNGPARCEDYEETHWKSTTFTGSARPCLESMGGALQTFEKMETTQWTSLSLVRPEKPSEPTSTSRSCIPNVRFHWVADLNNMRIFFELWWMLLHVWRSFTGFGLPSNQLKSSQLSPTEFKSRQKGEISPQKLKKKSKRYAHCRFKSICAHQTRTCLQTWNSKYP